MQGTEPLVIDIIGFKKKEFAIFCGAGISMNSGLPLANELIKTILGKLPIDESGINELINSNLPFEAFMESLSENKDISVILDIFNEGQPNTNHLLIARLAKIGYIKTIFTTNFDLFIEKALEKEGLKEDLDFKRYYNEEHFSELNFENLDDKIQIFKVHGSVDNKESIRTTLKTIASKNLSNMRMKAISYLFSTGNHKKVLILGYSCSDAFDITPLIKSIKENRKEVVFISHSEKEEIENIQISDIKNPFNKFNGTRIKYDTDKFIKELWNSFNNYIGKYHINESQIEWKKYVNEWIEGLSKKEHLKYLIAATLFYRISNFKKAVSYYDASFLIVKTINNLEIESKCYTGLGHCYRRLGDFDKAIEYFDLSLRNAKKVKDKVEEAKCYSNLSIVYRRRGDFIKAKEYIMKSLKINKKTKNKKIESDGYGNLANIYYSLKNYKRAITNYKKSIIIAEECGDISSEAGGYIGLGNAYNGNKDFIRAISFLEISLEIKKTLGEKVGESICYENLGNAYIGLSNFEKAVGCYKQSLTIAKEIGDKASEALCYKNIGKVYSIKGNNKKVIEYYLKAENVFEELGQFHFLEEVYKILTLTFKENGDSENEKIYQKKLNQINTMK